MMVYKLVMFFFFFFCFLNGLISQCNVTWLNKLSLTNSKNVWFSNKVQRWNLEVSNDDLVLINCDCNGDSLDGCNICICNSAE